MILTDFDSFYNSGTSQYVTHNFKERTEVLKHYKIENYNVSISNCIFRECTSTERGGAFYLNSKNPSIWLLVEDTSFIRCTTTNTYGGAIYFTQYSYYYGKSFLNRVCAFECSARKTSSSDGQCFYIDVGGDASYNNYVNDSCITNSINSATNSRYTQFVANGRIILTGENISRNECH
jgi:hypothetical protein